MNNSRQGKLAVIGGFILMFSVMGLVSNCFSLSIVPITSYFGFSRGSYAISQTLMFVCSAAFTLTSSRIYKKLDLVKAVRIAAVVVTAVFFLESFATRIWMFFISNALLGFCMAMCTSLPAGLLINEWIAVDANTFIGIAMMGSGVGGAVFNPMMNWLITGWGWQSAYRIMAVVMGVMAIPAAFLLMKRAPGAVDKRVDVSDKKSERKIPFMQKRLLIIAAVLFLSNGIAAALNFSINPHVQDLGYSAAFASMCSSLENAVMAVGKITVGRILDRKGAKTALYLSMGMTAVSLVCLAFFRSPVVIFLVLINLGLFFGCPIGTVGGVAVTSEAVGKEDMPAFVGTFGFAMSLGTTFAPMLLGNAYDIFGSYSPLLLALAAVLVLAMPLISIAFRTPLKTK